MIRRLRRIHSEFGKQAFFKTLLLLVGLIGMAIGGFVAFTRVDTALTAVGGVALGAVMRRPIARCVEYLPRILGAGLFVYGVVLFLGKRLGMDHPTMLLIITITTVIVFDLQFWSLSDPGVYNPEKRRSEPGSYA